MKNLRFIFCFAVLNMIFSIIIQAQQWKTSYPGNMYLYPNTALLSIGNGSLYAEKVTINEPGSIDPFGVRVDGTVKFKIKNDGKVGIGTSSPSYLMHVTGDIYVNGGWVRVSGSKGLYFQSHGGGFYMNDNTWIRIYNNKNFYQQSGILRTDGTFQVGLNGERFVVNSDGNVGIGCTNPQTELSVNGTITASRIDVVETVPCSDNVFETDYKLMTLHELDAFIKANNHLPEVPSAEEFKKNGYSLGEMDDLLLRKIEELTLYIIELEKRINTIEK